jgi:hypothetical protein
MNAFIRQTTMNLDQVSRCLVRNKEPFYASNQCPNTPPYQDEGADDDVDCYKPHQKIHQPNQNVVI